MTELSQPVNETSQLPPQSSKRPRRTRWVIWTLGTIVFLVLLLQGIGQLESRASSHLSLAVELVSQGHPVEAIETLDDLSQQTCRLFGRGTEVDETLALAHKLTGSYELAMSHHDRLIARFAGDANELPMRRIDRAHTLRAARRTEEALQEFEKAKEEMSRIADAEFKSHALSLAWDGIRRTQLDIGRTARLRKRGKKSLNTPQATLIDDPAPGAWGKKGVRGRISSAADGPTGHLGALVCLAAQYGIARQVGRGFASTLQPGPTANRLLTEPRVRGQPGFC